MLAKLLDLAPGLPWSGILQLHVWCNLSEQWQLLPRISVLGDGRVKRLELQVTPCALVYSSYSSLNMHNASLLGIGLGHQRSWCCCSGVCVCGL